MQEAAKAYQDMQLTTEAQASAPTASALIPDTSALGSVEAPMEVDHPAPERGTKRGPEEDEAPSEPHKKARIGNSSFLYFPCQLLNTKKIRAETSAFKKVNIGAFTFYLFSLTEHCSSSPGIERIQLSLWPSFLKVSPKRTSAIYSKM